MTPRGRLQPFDQVSALVTAVRCGRAALAESTLDPLSLLERGNARANQIADRTLDDVRELMGTVYA